MKILVNDECNTKELKDWFDKIDEERFEDYIDEFIELGYEVFWTKPNEGEEDFEIEYFIEPKGFLSEINMEEVKLIEIDEDWERF